MGPATASGEHIPFELTDLQRAYWLGEQGLYPLSTAAYIQHVYHIDVLDVDALRQALDRLVRRHDVLRTTVLEDGRQVVGPPTGASLVRYEDLSALSGAEFAAALNARRASVAADLPPLGLSPPFVVAVLRAHDGYRVLVVLRLFALDGRSLRRFFAELADLYRHPAQEAASPSGRYRKLVEAALDVPARRRAAATRYWEQRAGSLPPSACLPLKEPDALPGRSSFSRRQTRLPESTVALLRQRCAQYGVTVTAALCCVYVETLRRWSSTKDFTLNVLSSLRPITSEFDDVLGNLGTNVLVECRDQDGALYDQVRRLQGRLYAAVAHRNISGMEVLRRFSAAHQTSAGSFMPVVFAPGLGITKRAERPEMTLPGWRLLEAAMHTPQVLLDHQVYGDGKDLVLNWDFVEDAFPDRLIDDAFAYYRALLAAVTDTRTDWTTFDVSKYSLQSEHLLARWMANSTARETPDRLLHDGFLAASERVPDRVALVDGDTVLTYGQARSRVDSLAHRLREAGIGPGVLVAVLAPRGWRQIIAVLAAVRAGGAYVPIDIAWPQERIAWLLAPIRAQAVISAPGAPPVPGGDAALCQLEFETVSDPDDDGEADFSWRKASDPDDLAYVIYTSGSTGRPKGVAITHRAASNTVEDILERFNLTEHDRTLGLSALSFDLSVFDIFGLLSVGGAVVIPGTGAPDPAVWVAMVRDHRVTVWNSVPAIMEMTLDYLGDAAPDQLGSLRLVMLSGDWISMSLPDRIRSIAPGIQIVALGGATEASIWSNAFSIGEINCSWKSLPYGYPLTNQQMHILDRHLQPVPSWVPGDLYIAGSGLALGYHGDPEKTAHSFLPSPDGAGRLYRTGDLARYWQNGCVEFLGRADNQVKIDGYRIELGEVESTLIRYPLVHSAAVAVSEDRSGNRRMIAYVVPEKGRTLDVDQVCTALRKWLPAYMVPRHVAVVDSLPLTDNGKVDRTRLAATAWKAEPAASMHITPRSDVEAALVEAWEDVLDVSGISITDDFFALGGSSRAAVQLMNRVRDRLGTTIPLRSLFEHSTVESQAVLINTAGPRTTAEPSLVRIQPGSGMRHILVVHPIGGGVLCYRELAEGLAPDTTVLGAQHPGLEGTPISDGTVEDLARCYVNQIQRAGLPGELYLLGWSMGGLIAYEMAHQLRDRRMIDVSRIFMIDSWVAGNLSGGSSPAREFLHDLIGGTKLPAGIDELGCSDDAATVYEGLKLLKAAGLVGPAISQSDVSRLFRVYVQNYEALRRYRPPVPSGPVDLFIAQRSSMQRAGLVPASQVLDRSGGWVREFEVDADHFTIVTGNAAARVANTIRHSLAGL